MWAAGMSGGVATAAVQSLPEATPQIGGSATSGTDGTIEMVRQIVQCGSTMYAVGSFAQVRDAGSTTPLNRGNGMAFSAVAPHRLTAWDPKTNGQIDTVACVGDGSVLLGGTFTQAGSTTGIKNVIRVDGTTGAVLAPWNMSPGGRVAHIEVVSVGGVAHALVGGYFPGYLKSVNPLNGNPDNYVNGSTINVPISGNYVYPGVHSNGTRVWNMSVSPDQSAVLVTGDFTSVGNAHHEQIFRLNLGPTATVSGWSPTELYSHCAGIEPFYAQDAAWSQDMHTIYTATTGYRLYNDTQTARTGPCDAAIAYQADNQVEFGPGGYAGGPAHNWINYAGCDSLFAVAADADTVYVAGHERWIDNPNGCDSLGSGGRVQWGLGEIPVNTTTGQSVPGPNRGRGLGADDLLRTTAGLWIASDNQANTDMCSGKHGHMGICFLPN